MKPLMIFLCLSFVLGSSIATAGITQARLTFEPHAIIGSGFTPAGQVVLYGCANPPQPYYRRLLSFLNVVTVDAAGSLRWEVQEAISPNSVWFVVGSSPNDEVVAVPGRTTPPEGGLAAPRLLVGRDAGNDALAIDEYMDDIVIVRPNDTVWAGT